MTNPIKKRNPWWIPPFLGRVPESVSKPNIKLLGAVALAFLFEEYDLAMLISALKHISADLNMAQEDLPLYLFYIRLGALPAIFLIPFADLVGRRRVYLFSVAAMGLITLATAFVQSPIQYAICQSLCRTFFVTGSAVAYVIITEEFPAEHRGWGMGMLAAIGAIGHGLAAGVFSQIDRLPYGWRALYVFGVIPVLLLPYFMKRVPETKRFSNIVDGLSQARAGFFSRFFSMLEPIRALAITYPSRALGIVIASFMSSLAILPALQFSGYFVQIKHGWSPGHYALMVIVGGAVGIIGNIVAGRLSDRFGRRRVGFVLLTLFPICAGGFYFGPSWLVYISWTCIVFSAMGGRVILRTLSAELFPTEHRGSASGTYTVLETVGGATGMLVLYLYGTSNVEELSRNISIVTCTVLISAFILLTFPETSRRELEDISGPRPQEKAE
ncbi:MAG: MFS transporter [Proteobacteria bacterium]|nr:MFS transporter [Pseudomonadota bacterium]